MIRDTCPDCGANWADGEGTLGCRTCSEELTPCDRVKGEDDGLEYGHPGEELRERRARRLGWEE